MVAALEAEGITVRDAQQVMLDAREVKSIDEIMLLNTACAMVDGAYQLHLRAAQAGRPRERARRGGHASFLFDLGSEHVDNINAVSGERCSPHPHVFSDRIIRPGDQAFFDIIQTFVGYKTCYYRTFVVGSATDAQRDAYKRAREWIDASIELMRPGVGTDQVASVWPKAEEFGFANEMECFGLQFGHSVGLFLHERPIISRLNSLDHPVELKEGMVIALETYCPAKDGFSAARIEEEVVDHRRRAAGDHPLPVGRAVRRQRVLRPADGRASAAAPPTSRPRLAHVPDHGRVPRLRGARPGAVLRGPRPRHDASRRRARRPSPPGSRPRCAPTTTRSARTAATTTRSPAACRWRRSSPSCSGAATGLLGGKGGSMHLTSVEHGVMGCYAIVGAHLPIALGAAWSAQYRGSGQVAVCFFGDGTTNIGAFHEALNMAAVWKAAGRVRVREQPVHGVHADRRRDGGRRGRRRTGPPRTGSSRSSSTATTPTRCTRWRGRRSTGRGPARGRRSIEALTYRHGGHSRADPGKYRPDDEVKAWLAKDPIPRYRARLLASGADEATLDAIEAEARARSPRPSARRARRPSPIRRGHRDPGLGRRRLVVAEPTDRWLS